MRCVVVWWLISFSQSLFAVDVIRTIPPQSEHDVSHHYFITLLKLSLEETVDEYGASEVAFTGHMEQGRALHELQRGRRLDVYWAGTSLQREQMLRAVRIPLVKGLLGFRISLIRKASEVAFNRIQNLDDLKRFTACQGEHWPDSDILEAAGIPVRRGPIYELMFRQLDAGRCDYFPRGLHEGVGEMEARKQKFPEMMIYPDLIIYYPFPMYFFVNRANIRLAQRLELGLNRIIDKGMFDHHLRTHRVTRHLFPLEKWREKSVIILDNPLLPSDTQMRDQRYWILPDVGLP